MFFLIFGLVDVCIHYYAEIKQSAGSVRLICAEKFGFKLLSIKF